MLFNSYVFLFVFLPTTLVVYWLLGRSSHKHWALVWLVLSSLFYYGWWNPSYVWLILISMVVNYGLSLPFGNDALLPRVNRRMLLVIGIVFNLGLIGYFKYANFIVDNLNVLLKTDVHLDHIVLPLAISFFTFQQIAYLVDAYRQETREHSFMQYSLFVTFFPQLIAGPIVHHKEMLPQFARRAIYRVDFSNLSVGLTLLAIGLFKKVIIADGIAAYATPAFLAVDHQAVLSLPEAWIAALAYTFQLYFDFSGYSDMAIGVARLFGVILPLNFNSPYKATNIIDFWRRWHITLSRFLRDYLYIPLGGSRHGSVRRYVNLMITMLLGGLWHGAGWTFVVWGGLHGLYLVVNHGWRALRRGGGQNYDTSSWVGRRASHLLTFVAVVVGWVFFRASNLNSAVDMLQSMFGMNGVVIPSRFESQLAFMQPLVSRGVLTFGSMFPNGIFGAESIPWIILLLIVVWVMPNPEEFMQRYTPVLESASAEVSEWQTALIRWRPSLTWAVAVSIIAVIAVLGMSRVSEFLYFQF